MDTLANALTKMQNAIKVNKKEVLLKKSSLVEGVIRVLEYEKMIESFEITDDGFLVKLLYVEKEPVVTKFKKISKPGQRVYVSAHEIKPVANGRGIAVISTSEGILSGALAKSKKIGGEYLCEIQ